VLSPDALGVAGRGSWKGLSVGDRSPVDVTDWCCSPPAQKHLLISFEGLLHLSGVARAISPPLALHSTTADFKRFFSWLWNCFCRGPAHLQLHDPFPFRFCISLLVKLFDCSHVRALYRDLMANYRADELVHTVLQTVRWKGRLSSAVLLARKLCETGWPPFMVLVSPLLCCMQILLQRE